MYFLSDSVAGMPYYGRPSGACERCRPRRLKCDQEKPACTQCVRAGVNCPGYRDPLAFRFRDQSQEVIRKAQSSSRRRVGERSVYTESVMRTEESQSSLIELPQELSCSMEDLGMGYLFTNYIVESPRGGCLSCLSTIVQDPQSSALHPALTAVGLAALSNIRMCPSLMVAARRQYVSALSQTNEALRSPILSKTDSTLATVALLGMFELMTCSNGLFVERWMNHMEGATKLLEIRGIEQLTRPEGLRLFSHLRAQIIIGRIYQENYASPVLSQLTEVAKSYRDPDDQILDQICAVILRLGDLCASTKRGAITEPVEIIRMALCLDAELISLALVIPLPWSYRTVKVPLTDGEPISQGIWGDSYHIYRSATASGFWNNYRSARLIIHEYIIDAVSHSMNYCLEDMGGQDQRIRSQSGEICRELIQDICASVPFHLGARMEDNQLTGLDVESPTTLPSIPDVPVGIGSTMVWPLLIATHSEFAPKGLRQWISTTMEKIGHSMGINQALVMAHLLREGKQTSMRSWLYEDGISF